ncbi:tol-pal system-associated acyl-CoA thioesterase [Aureimonas phyllosphaerae]|uniref:Acyl-CoA thioester hydrolase n=1 Tax=Aureimonas phyllosphaerae TaxID=1166078 RepID=A0A7W6BQZ9_9HYPH|nr:tol-pal system-associated acyl-CoA thioesterase [Aureimonas phyllosphaerae]MBB3934419.1 acyl-CoA thioester hydrolase [Aureimonas phyllosphaerae]MBB3958365.1 acyl-CoA thioester hydrolase [Aureimonas phyllosphaerae]SFE95946.1 (3S)-malyl-CoA thioesterase [Aureimonas phyllosphaerae]
MTDQLAGRLVDGGHRLDVRVYFEDTDFSGVVYHARYLHFLERGRTDYLRLHGIGHRELMDGAFGEPMAFAVRRMEIEFLRPARIDDILSVETRTALLGGARVVLDQRILRGDEVLIEARVKVAVISPDGRPRRMPAAVAERLGAPEA